MRLLPVLIYEWFFRRVLHYFKAVNLKAGKTIALWFMKLETFEHVGSVIKVFKLIILPASLFYLLANLYFLKEISVGSALVGVIFFFYSNFLPDIPAIFRSKYYENFEPSKRLQRYKNCALLLFAPLFVVLFFFGKKISWRTTETFHNVKSLAIYICFLSLVGFLLFVSFPIVIGDLVAAISLPLYGMAGYLTHLRVDFII